MQNQAYQMLQKLKTDFPFYAKKCLKIKDKSGQLVRFVLNRAQLHIHKIIEEQKARTGKVRVLIVKGRQEGASTYIAGRFYHQTTMIPGIDAFIMAHLSDSTRHLFGMAKRYYDNSPTAIRPGIDTSNEKRMVFAGINSGYSVGTAGSAQIGRGLTIQLFHGSETAFFENTNEITTGILQAIPDALGTEIIFESTANGVGNMFHQMAMQGMGENPEGDFITIFVPWFWADEYAKEPPSDFELTTEEETIANLYSLNSHQMYWRRRKIIDTFRGDVWKFKQEYPCVDGKTKVMTGSGIKTLDMVEQGELLESGKVEQFLPKGKKECVRLTTRSGYEVVCTPDHRLLTPKGFVAAEQMLEKSVVLAAHVFPQKHMYLTSGEYHKSFSLKILADEDFARFLGYFVGDGSLSSGCFSFVSNSRDTDLILDVKRLATKYTPSVMCTRKVGKNGVEIRFSDTVLAQVFDVFGFSELRPDGRRKRKVHVPAFVWQSPRSVAGEFLKGLIATDGFVYNNCASVKVFTKYTDFAEDIQLLFTALGYRCAKRAVSKKAGNGKLYTGWELILPAVVARQFKRDFGFLTKWQNKHAEERQGKHTFKDLGFTNKVVKIEPVGEREVFDLVVPASNTFNAGGVIVHNCSVQESFVVSGVTLLSAEQVATARACKITDASSPVVIGCDPARNKDRTTITIRRGREIIRWLKYETMDEMTLAGILATQIDKYLALKCFVDTGYGYGTIDRLRELGYGQYVTGVHFGATKTLLEPDTYVNKRAEMADLVREWFVEGSVNIPDDDEFHMDMLAVPPLAPKGSRGLLALPPKDEIIKLFGKSPDIFDSLMLTFAFPVASRGAQNQIKRVELNVRRPSSPSSTIRDFNRNTGSEKKIYKAKFDIN